MPKVTPTSSRKADHIQINLNEDVRSGLTTGLESYFFTHEALPEIDLESVDLGQTIFGKRLQAPILISSMTGGTPGSRADQPGTSHRRSGDRHCHGVRIAAGGHRAPRTGVSPSRYAT